jgi:hypothetical protein
MLQASAKQTWYVQSLDDYWTPATLKVYWLFLFIVCVVTVIKLGTVWRSAPPSKVSVRPIARLTVACSKHQQQV